MPPEVRIRVNTHSTCVTLRLPTDSANLGKLLVFDETTPSREWAEREDGEAETLYVVVKRWRNDYGRTGICAASGSRSCSLSWTCSWATR